MIDRGNIVFVDRDGDVLSVEGRRKSNPIPDPVLTVTHNIRRDDWDSGHAIINSGNSQSIIFTEDEFRAFMKDAWERVLGEPFPSYHPPMAG